MAQTRLTRIDAPPLRSEQFVDDFAKWLSNLTDTINHDIELIEGVLADHEARLVAGGL